MTASDASGSGESVAAAHGHLQDVLMRVQDEGLNFDPHLSDDEATAVERFARSLLLLVPDDLDAMLAETARDAAMVKGFAKAALRADRARLPRHRDIVWNIWDENVQRRLGWLHEGLTYNEAVFSSVEMVTEPHDGADCPFLDGDDIPMVVSDEPLVIEAPRSASSTEPT